MPLDDLSPVPRYRQVAEIIRARIETGELAEGDAIPSRLQLQDEYGIARDTAAKALKVLVDAGLVVVVPGRGARVARRGLEGAGVAWRDSRAEQGLKVRYLGITEGLRLKGVAVREGEEVRPVHGLIRQDRGHPVWPARAQALPSGHPCGPGP